MPWPSFLTWSRRKLKNCTLSGITLLGHGPSWSLARLIGWWSDGPNGSPASDSDCGALTDMASDMQFPMQRCVPRPPLPGWSQWCFGQVEGTCGCRMGNITDNIPRFSLYNAVMTSQSLASFSRRIDSFSRRIKSGSDMPATYVGDCHHACDICWRSEEKK